MSSYYMRQGYAIVAKDRGETGHWFGGEPYHNGAQCPVCRVPLLLLADLDCTQIRTSEDAKLFHSLDRLPLYYCWRCCAEHFTYLIIDGKRIRVLRNEGTNQGEDFPYEEYPRSFPRRPVVLVPIDYGFGKLLAVYQEVDEYWLSDQDRRSIARRITRFRHSGFSSNDVNRHQIGGILGLIQGHESVCCPNSKCKAHKSAKAGYANRMKELAVLCNDPRSGLPMAESSENPHWNEWVQVVFWVCEECLAIAASNRCD